MRHPFKKKQSQQILLLLLLLSFFLNGYLVIERYFKEAVVTGIVDGNTLALANGEQIKILGVHTPPEGNCYSLEAKIGLTDLVLNKPIWIQEEQRDAVGRRVALIYVGKTLLNTKLIELGFAKPEASVPFMQDKFIAAYEKARESKTGVNSNLCTMTNAEIPFSNI